MIVIFRVSTLELIYMGIGLWLLAGCLVMYLISRIRKLESDHYWSVGSTRSIDRLLYVVFWAVMVSLLILLASELMPSPLPVHNIGWYGLDLI